MNGSKNFSIDSSEWELSKENVQPIKQGRKIPNLMAALAPNGEDAHWKLQKDKQTYEAEIRTYDGEDGLDVWYRYILWTEENLPKGGREIGTLLERCIKEFTDITKYKSDERYLQVWLKYADCCADPLAIFNYIHSQGVSSTLSQLYIAWASACESVENYKKADQVLMLGVERNAQPQDKLKNYHMGFQRRLASRIATSDELQPPESLENSRTALGSLKTCGKKKLVGVQRKSIFHNQQTGQRASGFGNSQNNRSSFSVLHDPDSENKLSQLPEALGDWKDPPAQSIITKENVSLPGKWTKEKPSSRSGSTIPLVRPVPKQSFQVHVEENAEQKSHGPLHGFGNQVLTTRKPDFECFNDPLKVIVKQQNENELPVTFKVMYDKGKVYTGTEEFQFEEIRAAKYAAFVKQGRLLPKDINRVRREKEEAQANVKRKHEKAMYQKEKVYDFHGEFQPEEIMARLYFERGKRLRQMKTPKIHRTCISATESTITKECQAIHSNPYTAQTDTHLSLSQVLPPDINTSNLSVNKSTNEIMGEQDENIVVRKKSENDENNLGRISGLHIQRRALQEVADSATSHTPDNKSENKSVNNPCQTNIVDAKLSDKISQLTIREKFTCNLVGRSPTLTTKQAFADVMPWFNTTVGLDNSDEDFEADFKNDPSTDRNPDLLVFGVPFGGEFDVAGVKHKPNNICDFRDRDEENLPPSGYSEPKPIGETFGVPGVEPNNIYDFRDEDAENLPPIGYTQSKIERPRLGVLQPSIGIPFEPLKDNRSSDEADLAKESEEYNSAETESSAPIRPPVGYTQPKIERTKFGVLQPFAGIPFEPLKDNRSSDADVCDLARGSQYSSIKTGSIAPVRYEKIKDHCSDEDVTNFQGLNHSQFTAAARLASTPFEDDTGPTVLPTFHCSTIHPSDVLAVSGEEEARTYNSESERPSANIISSSFNTPSKVLSPILECSDEDAKTSSSGASSHSSSSTKSNVGSHCINQSEATNLCPTGHEVSNSSRTGCDSRERSLDITVQNANGDVLKVVNPFDPAICIDLLSHLSEPVNTYPGYHDVKDKPMTKIAAQKAVDLGEDLYRIGKSIGSGSFGKVFMAKKLSVDFTNDDEEDIAKSTTLALKVQTPANEWEFYVCSELHKRLKRLGKSNEELSTIAKIEDFYVFSEGSCFLTKFHDKGTFLDLVNFYKSGARDRLMENIAVYYVIELMKILECIHECGIIHGDIKPDNLVLTGSDNCENEEERGLALIDFGCAIDVSIFPPGTRFTVQTNTESFECIEMKTGRPWTTQVDTYGMLGSLHCLLFGEYMKVYQDKKNDRWRPIKLVNRTWNRNLWSKLFDVFLNIPSCDELPPIRAIREEFQEYFDRTLKKAFPMHKKKQTAALVCNISKF